MGDWIGVHGAGFEGADALPADGIKSVEFEHEPVMPVGIAVLPSTGGGVKNVTVGSSAPGQRDVISATLIGVLAGAGGGTSIEGLTLSEDTVGPAISGSESSGAIGALIGVLAGGNVAGLKVSGGNYSGDGMGVILGEGLSSPVVEGVGFGSGSQVPEDLSKAFGLSDAFGLVLANTEDAQIGGPSASQGNKFRADVVGVGLLGGNVRRDSLEHNILGDEVKTFTTFLKGDYEFANVMGVLALGNGCSKKASQSQEVTLGSNRVEGDVIGAFSICTTGFTLRNNNFENSAFGILDAASGGMHIGTPGQGNAFVTDGFGVLQANFEPTAADYSQAQVSPEDASPKTRQKYLSAPDEELAYDGLDAVTALDFTSTSTEAPSAEGTHNSYYGNRFGVGAGGEPRPDELPVLIGGDEHEVRFGGTGAGEGNTVEDNRFAGLWIANFGPEHDPTVQVLGNTFYNNENFTGSSEGYPGLGIDLYGEIPGFGPGVNEQDPKQPDSRGPNYFQNSPVLSSATVSSGTLTLTGSLHGVASTEYLLEVFADENQNPFGAGEGQTLLERIKLTTNAEGNAGFTSTVAAPVGSYRYVSSTATTVPGPGIAGVTSEFSVNTPITAAAPGGAPAGGASPGATSSGSGASSSSAGSTAAGAGTTGTGAATTTVSSQGATVSTSGSSVTLPAQASCSSATASPCTVTTTATVAAASAGKASVSAVSAKSKQKHGKPVTIGRATMTLAPGASAPLQLKLSSSGLALLRSRGSLAITVTVSISGHGRGTTTHTLHFQLKYKKAKGTAK
jgi:hypothetical protein